MMRVRVGFRHNERGRASTSFLIEVEWEPCVFFFPQLPSLILYALLVWLLEVFFLPSRQCSLPAEDRK